MDDRMKKPKWIKINSRKENELWESPIAFKFVIEMQLFDMSLALLISSFFWILLGAQISIIYCLSALWLFSTFHPPIFCWWTLKQLRKGRWSVS